MELVHHVCKEAPEGLDSVFLIWRSNCGFANYKDEGTCDFAVKTVNESKFQQAKLLSKLRKNEVKGASGATAPTGPAGATLHSHRPTTPEIKEVVTADSTEIQSLSSDPDVSAISPVATAPVMVDAAVSKDRYFIMKSLTLPDLDCSVKTGLWATQKHNEATLNNAFKVSSRSC